MEMEFWGFAPWNPTRALPQVPFTITITAVSLIKHFPIFFHKTGIS